ncbi:MAG: hemolysin III family protein [Acidobacteria bacterium]|uniref:Hemolysin III family protein n=1 Tax=Candidatus Polarisedimenticola svalbardensis TaxID=2886004 RepID=A0A8J7CDV0_9BACT|nr:hemolysin III family protein [Candidatus Polarisedimenticola svalbardensis]
MSPLTKEEIANSVSHGIGVLLAVAAVPVLVVGAVRRGTAADIVGASVFGAAMVLMYLSSTLYHALPQGKSKSVFRVLDHCAIFLMIAGTYTPFTLGVLFGGWGWTLFGLVWGVAAAGIVLKAVAGIRFKVFSTLLYIAMGWLMVIAIKPLLSGMEPAGLLWLLAGGLAYTLGAAVYAIKGVRYSHFVWHLFVLAGSACHFVAVLGYSSA